MNECTNDFIRPLKQLCKFVCLAPRDCNYISPSPAPFLAPRKDTCWINKQGERGNHPSSPLPLPLPLLLLPLLDRTKVASSLLPGTFSEGGNEQSRPKETISHVIFPEHRRHPRSKGYSTWSWGAEMVRFTSPLWVTWSITAAWTWPETRTGIRGGDFCELTGRWWRHVQG